ncbi:ATP-binding domain-containing protein [Qipengyuania sp. GH1]|uniref:DEAD/DEAH box helicase n=1 Tax=Qipengyuania aestuarii TaxID=2867241 RepID=UPI001C86A86A|nr:ATP-binding domain-containing protein [Qipengyuania aestuarii]MBX7534513.1 ATP-binding domain-containing protein [Qipengyuania aestuarii]
MSLEIVVTTSRWKNDPVSRELVDYLSKNSGDLNLDDAVLYYDFPAYVDYSESKFRPDLLLLSPVHGFVAFRCFQETIFQRSEETLEEIDIALGDFASNLHSRIIKSRSLRKTRTESIVPIHTVILIQGGGDVDIDLDSQVLGSLESVENTLTDWGEINLSSEELSETRSVVEGAKALGRPSKRIVKDEGKEPLAAALARLENEIINFDEKQRNIALVEVGGPARIRGLAGTGKTVILAMKAAHIHLTNPEAQILVTFYTKSLRSTIKQLITKFYRIYSDADPDWKRIHIRHGWGGVQIPGVYSDACKRAGVRSLKFPEARSAAKQGEDPFGAACRILLEAGTVKSFYDHVLIDEGQDFPDSFYKLAYEITEGARDKKNIVWAYDELQDILNIHIRQPKELFGTDSAGQALVDLDRSAATLPPGATNDAVLEKAYRNQLQVLVAAHALGFGVYGQIVQMLESKEHWEDVGYEVPSGSLVEGDGVTIVRPERNSPLHVPEIPNFPVVDHHVTETIHDEVRWIAESIKDFLVGGLSAEEILVISLDDRNARAYFRLLSEALAFEGISSNNVIADPYNEPPFSIVDKVTLSTVYRAKGNEAAAVFVLGIDSVSLKSRGGRNKLFTAMTRSKVWLRMSGLSHAAMLVVDELSKALDNSPKMQFVMPNLKRIETIQRGFSKKQEAAKAAREEYIRNLRAAGLSDEEIDEELKLSSNAD